MDLFEIMSGVVKNHNETADIADISERYIKAHPLNIIEKIDIISVAYPEVARHLERLNNSDEQDQNTAEDIADCIFELLNNKEE